jgi:hypothetical protein
MNGLQMCAAYVEIGVSQPYLSYKQPRNPATPPLIIRNRPFTGISLPGTTFSS